MKIDEAYFRRYAGSKTAYAKVWRRYSYSDECIAYFRRPGATRIRSVMVLGAATGQVCELFDKGLGVRPWGCEMNAWAHGQIEARYRRKIRLENMTAYVNSWVKDKKRVDLAYANSLIYLTQKELKVFLPKLARCARELHFRSSVRGSSCPDPYRRTLKSYQWWCEQMKRAGFEEVRDPKSPRTRLYLWRSVVAK